MLAPLPRLTLSEWADRYAYLSPETSASHGKFKAFAYQKGIMDAVTDPSIETVTVMKSARVGFTKCLDHVVGYHIHQDPCPILLVQPRVEDAADYSRDEIAPMLRDTPVLAKLTGDLRSRDSDQRIRKRTFRNGASVSFVGANAPSGFRRITARVILFDEVDGYPPQGAGVEGDQIALGTKRSESFWNRKIVMGSTPLVKATSRILKSYEQSDQRRYHVPCPHCGHRQPLAWSGIRWTDGDPDTAHYVCEANGCIIDEADKPWMIDNGEWVAAKTEVEGHAGFHIWAGYSLFPNAAWPKLVAEFLSVKDDPTRLRTFINLVLGEPWEDQGEEVDQHVLASRATEEAWSGDAPPEVLLVTCGVDVQGDRLEVERIGWGLQEESWSLDYQVIYGDPSAPELWNDLEDYLLTPTVRADGHELAVASTAIDSGGHSTDEVYNFVRGKTRRRVWAIKGASQAGKAVWPKRASKNNKGRVLLYVIGTDAAKDTIYGRFRISAPGPGYCHVPADRDPEWFEQVTAETVVTRFVKGVPTREWVRDTNVRNEALDCRVYGFAALRSMSINWSTVRRMIEQERSATPTVEPTRRRSPGPRMTRSSFLGR